MKIKKNKQGYILHQTTKNNISVCRIIKEYKSLEEAQEGLVRLLTGNITEKGLEKEI